MKTKIGLLALLTLGACGPAEVPPQAPQPEISLGKALGPSGDAELGVLGEERFQVRSVVAVPVGSAPRGECHRGNVRLLLSGQEIDCVDGEYQIREPRLEIMVPLVEGQYGQPASGECILEGESNFYVSMEWSEGGTHDATVGSVSIESMDPQGIRGRFAFQGWEDADFKLEGAFYAKRCGI